MIQGERPYILVVEDNRDTQILLHHLLNPSYRIQIAASFDVAMQCLDSDTYHLFILDINLGEKRTGIDLLNYIRASVPLRETPSIALTAYSLPGDRERFLAHGFDAYVSKPFMNDDLMMNISKLINHSPSDQNK